MPPYVGVGWRAVAAVVDLLVLVVLIWVVGVATGSATDEGGVSLRGPVALLPPLLWLLYYIGLEATVGATLGKLVLGLRVVRADGGSPIGWGPAVARNVLRIVDGLLFYGVGALLVQTSPTRQRLGDRVAGTVVVRRGSVGAPVVVV